MFQVCKTGDFEKVKSLLNEDILTSLKCCWDVYRPTPDDEKHMFDERKLSPIHYVASGGHTQVSLFIIVHREAGQDIMYYIIGMYLVASVHLSDFSVLNLCLTYDLDLVCQLALTLVLIVGQGRRSKVKVTKIVF